MLDLSVYKNKKVFITGHTGFKGSWLCKVLDFYEANITGYSLRPPTEPNLYDMLEFDREINSILGDVSCLEDLSKALNNAKPDVVIHMAAETIVRESYHNPVKTYTTNVMGTVNILEAIRTCETVKSFVNVTTDKVYENHEWCWGYRENDQLNGFDPYSNSKSCSELVTDCYRKSFLNENGKDGRAIAISTCRAGNVIGGGDFSSDRIIPDCVRSIMSSNEMVIRNPHSVRPFQHVLEPIFAYLKLAHMQYENPEKMGYYNIGPNEIDCINTEKLVKLFEKYWNGGFVIAPYDTKVDNIHESEFLKLDCSKIKSKLGIKPKWNIETAVEKTVEWTKAYLDNKNINDIMSKQIKEYLN